MLRFNDILERLTTYNPNADTELLKKAYVFSAKVHLGQVRLSGEPYLNHPLEVAGILTQLKLDVASVATGLLHDAVEDTLATPKGIQENFGEEITHLVDGLTKISQISLRSAEEHQAENFRKMILAMVKDIRVILIKLADRLHNMRTLKYHTLQKQAEIAQETLDIYAPLAHRLGIDWIKSELENLAFQYLYPEIYEEIRRRIAKKEKERERYIEEVKRILMKKLYENRIEGEVTGRLKQTYSIYLKMKDQNIDFDQVYDINALMCWASFTPYGNPSQENSKITSAFQKRICINPSIPLSSDLMEKGLKSRFEIMKCIRLPRKGLPLIGNIKREKLWKKPMTNGLPG
jgi:guanosine-3',5'-bis(diphosphate) 3'-pyrophosphohydrolase